MESIRADDACCIKLDDGQQLKWWRRISFYWKEAPADDILSVILLRPAGSEYAWLVVSKVTFVDSSRR